MSFLDDILARFDAAAPRREGAVKSGANTLAGVYDLLANLANTTMPNLGSGQATSDARGALAADPSNPSAPNITPTPNEQGGYTAANIAQFLLPTPAGKAALPLQAAQSGLLTHLQGGDAGDSLESAAWAGLAPPVIGKAAGALKNGAVRQYERALGATRESTKAAAARIAPEMIERGVTGSIPKLAETGAAKADEAGGQIRVAYDAATQRGVLVSTAPALRGLDKLKNRYVTQGAGGPVATNPEAVSRIEKVEDILTRIGPTATPNQLWQVRMSLDEIVGGAFDVPQARSTAKEIAKVARQGLQGELDKADPAIRALNREFGLWKDLEKVAGATQRRRTSQELPLATMLFGAAGAGAEFARGGDPLQSLITGAGAGAAARGWKSPTVRTNVAVGQDRLAGLLGGAMNPISRLLAALSGGAQD